MKIIDTQLTKIDSMGDFFFLIDNGFSTLDWTLWVIKIDNNLLIIVITPYPELTWSRSWVANYMDQLESTWKN